MRVPVSGRGVIISSGMSSNKILHSPIWLVRQTHRGIMVKSMMHLLIDLPQWYLIFCDFGVVLIYWLIRAYHSRLWERHSTTLWQYASTNKLSPVSVARECSVLSDYARNSYPIKTKRFSVWNKFGSIQFSQTATIHCRVPTERIIFIWACGMMTTSVDTALWIIVNGFEMLTLELYFLALCILLD